VKWFRLRVALALGVLALLVVELSGHRTWLVVVPQALFIVGITSSRVSSTYSTFVAIEVERTGPTALLRDPLSGVTGHA